MFYSHEILTSPEHGVAIIWLVATLGSRSIARRLNRKTILDVDVPEACRVIVNPQAPMALRLQGSLLYGVSRVYHQQCGYTLLDAQAMHDKMVSLLKVLPGGGLDPSAGKAKPTSLILPYDDTFLPETGLPGIGIELALLSSTTGTNSSQQLTLWTSSPAFSQSSASQVGNIHLELPSDDISRDAIYADDDSDAEASAQKRGLFGKKRQADLEDEEGVLLQPDFEFDDLGNIVEFDASHHSPHKRRRTSASPRGSERPSGERSRENEAMQQCHETATFALDDDRMDIDVQNEEHEHYIVGEHETESHVPTESEERQRRVHQRQARTITPDGVTSLRNTDLARWNNDYQANMVSATKQKDQNKMPTVAKKNAAYWVFGKGIAAVGIGLGTHHAPHPLSCFSGEELYNTFFEEIKQSTKRPHSVVESDTEEARHIRARTDQEDELMDVEIGRQGPSSILDDHSSQMPWNVTASIQSSRRGPRFGSISELSNASRRGRLTSASPLAGRGYLDPREQGLGLDMPGNADDELDELDITRYLEGELAADHEDISVMGDRRVSEEVRIRKELDQESLNFWEFIKDDLVGSLSKERQFDQLLPPEKTSRAVATQGFMNLLTLATRGAILVWQDRATDRGHGHWGSRYDYGAIWLSESGSGMKSRNEASGRSVLGV